MSVRRVAAAAAVVLLAVLVGPAAAAPGLNGADLVVMAAPIVLLRVCVPRSPQIPAGGATAPIDVPRVPEPPAGPRT